MNASSLFCLCLLFQAFAPECRMPESEYSKNEGGISFGVCAKEKSLEYGIDKGELILCEYHRQYGITLNNISGQTECGCRYKEEPVQLENVIPIDADTFPQEISHQTDYSSSAQVGNNPDVYDGENTENTTKEREIDDADRSMMEFIAERMRTDVKDTDTLASLVAKCGKYISREKREERKLSRY